MSKYPVEDKYLSLLSTISIFRGLSTEEIASFVDRIDFKVFKKGEIILLEEDANKYMYAVLQGEAKVFHVTEEGKETILAFHGAGDSFGEISLIDQNTMPATVVAFEEAVVAIIGRSDFFQIIKASPGILDNLLFSLASSLRQSWEQIRMLHVKDAPHRVRTLLKNLVLHRGEIRNDDVLLKIRLTHQSIADMTGMTRETVTRVIDKWKQAGIIVNDQNRHMQIKRSFLEKDFIL